MRILLGAVRGLAFFTLMSLAQGAAACEQLPAGQTLFVRLSSPVSTYSAHVGDAVHAVLTQDVICGKDVVLPMGTPVEGVVKNKHKVGWGLRYETAALELEFHEASLGPDTRVQMTARVEEVENARENVKHGVIHGVMSSDTFQGRVNSHLIHMPTWNPYTDVGLILYKATFPIFPEPEIYYPAGTDLRLKTKDHAAAATKAGRAGVEAGASSESQLDGWLKRGPQPIVAGVPALDSVGLAHASALLPRNTHLTVRGDADGMAQIDAWLNQVPRRTTTKKLTDADLINIVFVGSEPQVEAAFREAGWHNSDKVSKHAFFQNFYALLNNSGYAQQPMKTFLMDGKPQDMSWQKGLNSYGRRDHLRIWQWTPEGATEPVWVSSSTHDTGAILSVKYHGFIHHIAPDIDDERAKVIRDLNFEGCVKSVSYVARPGMATMTQNATGDLVRTDGSVAVVQLQECQPVVPGLPANPTTAGYKPGNYVFRYIRKEILTVRNDIWRANMLYGAYDLGRMAVLAMRHHPVQPPIEAERPANAVVAVESGSGSN